ncbi:hypothetical protein [Paludibacterium yongneupense]|uniref:hypothetical protein n=1 Tax=Paludibacterium yongneupense TaxID=400061 RepID=UPI00040E8ADA|nr:hypothetical protein [Paludibacterium yongneupense]
MKLSLSIALSTAAALCQLAGTPASAGSILWTAPSACGTLNCDATILHANITTSSTNPGGSIEPFVIQVHGSPQYCTRLDVFQQNADMQMVVVAPDGTVWKNDDRVPGDLRPLVVIPAGVQGWYTVQVSLYGGRTTAPGVHYNADLAYGRYTSTTNPNCANPSRPSAVGQDTPKATAGMPREIAQ